MPLVRGHLESQGLSATASSVVQQAWRSGTKKQYSSYLRRWEQYCSEREISPISATVVDGVNFLGELYQKGLSYSAINTARSALSTVIHPAEGCTFGNHPLVSHFLKGDFTARPALPRYHSAWDVAVVLKYLRTLHPPEKLTLTDLSLKTTMLIALLSGQRCQTIHALDVTNMTLSEEKCVFYIHELLKTSRPGNHFGCLEPRAYCEDKQLCVVTFIQEYVKRTSVI